MITLIALGLKCFGRKTKPARPTKRQSPFLLGSSSARRTHQRLRSDPGGEFTSNRFTAYLQQQRTERHLTMDDTLRHNSVAESLNCRLMERTRAILHQAGFPKHLWAKAIHFAIWPKIRTSTKALGSVTH